MPKNSHADTLDIAEDMLVIGNRPILIAREIDEKTYSLSIGFEFVPFKLLQTFSYYTHKCSIIIPILYGPYAKYRCHL